MKNKLRYYTQYLCYTINSDGKWGGPQLCHFGDSSTTRGVRIGGRLCLSFEDALAQCEKWSEVEPGHVNPHRYVVYASVDVEAGETPLLPGMTDRDFLPRTRAEVGHVVGQGGICWCREHHADAVPGDNVSLPAPGWTPVASVMGEPWQEPVGEP